MKEGCYVGCRMRSRLGEDSHRWAVYVLKIV